MSEIFYFVLFIQCKISLIYSAPDDQKVVNVKSAKQSQIFETPILIWWTSRIFPHLEKVARISCSGGLCLSTSKRHYQSDSKARAFLFYGTDFNVEDLPLPRKNYHEWALLHEESPMNNFIFSHSSGIQLFNHTSTFSRESHYPLTTQFIPSLKYLTERKPMSTSEKNKLRKKGLAPVVYVQSHCNVASDRDRYVKELMKYIKVDSYGKCLHNKAIPEQLESSESYDSEEFLDLLSQYKFHIAFENAICNDYISEKLFRPLHVGSIPIYKGSPSVKDWIPTNRSVIVVDDFKNPKDLAKYIEMLDQNDDEYNSYLEYKNNHGITNLLLLTTLAKREWGVNDLYKDDFFRGFECYVCNEIIHNTDLQNNIRKGLLNNSLPSKVANKKHMDCPEPHTSLEFEKHIPLNDEWLQQDWVESFWYAYDQARALQLMIRNKENNSSNFLHYALKYKYQH